MSRYAADTSVSVANSKAEIEHIIERYGATGFMSGWSADQAMIAFAMQERQIRFILTMPSREEREFTHHSKGRRTPEAAHKAWEQACRQRWRALALVIKAKLEAVSAGISQFDDEFLSHIVLPDGKTVGAHVRPMVDRAYISGQMQPLLPDYSDGESGK